MPGCTRTPSLYNPHLESKVSQTIGRLDAPAVYNIACSICSKLIAPMARDYENAEPVKNRVVAQGWSEEITVLRFLGSGTIRKCLAAVSSGQFASSSDSSGLIRDRWFRKLRGLDRGVERVLTSRAFSELGRSWKWNVTSNP